MLITLQRQLYHNLQNYCDTLDSVVNSGSSYTQSISQVNLDPQEFITNPKTKQNSAPNPDSISGQVY